MPLVRRLHGRDSAVTLLRLTGRSEHSTMARQNISVAELESVSLPSGTAE